MGCTTDTGRIVHGAASRVRRSATACAGPCQQGRRRWTPSRWRTSKAVRSTCICSTGSREVRRQKTREHAGRCGNVAARAHDGPEVLKSNVEGDDTRHDATMFNPRHCHMTQAEARSAATDAPIATTTDVACVLGPSRVPAVDTQEAIGHQVQFLRGMRMPAQQRFRHVNWLL